MSSPFSYSAAAGVLLVLETALEARALLQPHLVAALDQVARRRRHQRDTAFESLGFLRYANPHDRSPMRS
jgi:hypothetical protein